jgi:glycosyltransferase involved in cell wall biosynthesis
VLRRIIRASDAVTVISTYTGQLLREYDPNVEGVIIPFGAAASVGPVTRQSPVAPSAARRPEDPFELLFVGRLVRRKGVDVLLRALALLAGDKRLTVRIVGGGPEKTRLEALASELKLGQMVRFDGVVSAEEIAGRFQACDALVLPAIVTERGDTEGLGVVLLEAMEYTKPVIGSAAGGIVDIVKDRETGLLVPPGDAKSLADAITYAMDHPQEMQTIAVRGRQFAADSFGWDAIISRLSQVYESAVAARRGS